MTDPVTDPSPLLVQPFGADYFARALRAANALTTAAVRETIGKYDIVGEVAGEHASILIGRGSDGTLTALKGFAPPTSSRRRRTEIRHDEAFRMIGYGHSGVLTVGEILTHHPLGAITYLCMPYCQGGSLRDRVAAGSVTVEEAAYHGLALACTMRGLHDAGVIHGDIKPDNVLFGHLGDDAIGRTPRWGTWLSDLETLSNVGSPPNWRMTPAYAAPEQLAGEPAAASMDVWAWGVTMREVIATLGPLRPDWQWLEELVARATSQIPADRPTADAIIGTCTTFMKFGSGEHADAKGSSAEVVRYPIELTPQSQDPRLVPESAYRISMSMGWSAWLPEIQQLYSLGTAPALRRIKELCTRVLGDPADPRSLLRTMRTAPPGEALPIPDDAGIRLSVPGTDISGFTVAKIPRAVALDYLNQLTISLVELVERSAALDDIRALRTVAKEWEALDEFAHEADTARLAQAWLSLDEPERALPYVRRCFADDRLQPAALATMRMYYLTAGNYETASTVALQPKHGDGGMALRFVLLALVDMLEAGAGQYAEADDILSGFPTRRIDMIDTLRLVLAGRQGPVRPDADWAALREHFMTSSSGTPIANVRFLAEAAFQRGEVAYAQARAEAVRGRLTMRLPINHRMRASLEALALGQDPTQTGLTARLNNRAELWRRDGRPEDPLVALDFLAAERWLDGPDRHSLSDDVKALVVYSNQDTTTRDLFGTAWRRRCSACGDRYQLDNMSVCGSCHRLMCVSCVPDQRIGAVACRCGGELA